MVDRKDKRFLKLTAVTMYALSLLLFVVSNQAKAAQDIISVTPYYRPLEIYSIPSQQAHANSDFIFNLKPYFSRLESEADFVMTNNLPFTVTAVKLEEVPIGLVRSYVGDNVCAESFALSAKQSCVLRYLVDKSNYPGLLRRGPVLSFGTNRDRWSLHGQFNEALAHDPGMTKISVTPASQGGLSFDSQTASIVGRPTHTGNYSFVINASNGVTNAAPQILMIHVNVNLRDKPLFKRHYTLTSAMPEREYRLNLLDLIEPVQGFMETNQVQFRIDIERDHPSWLSIKSDDAVFLHGIVPLSEAGKKRSVTVIATSNTGGDSLPLTISIPVAFDSTKKPIFKKNSELTSAAGMKFQYDFRTDIIDSTADNSLKIIIDKIEPEAPWLMTSPMNPTELIGVVPMDAVGQIYQLTLHANNAIGGSSDPVTIPLQINTDEIFKPHFYLDKPQLPPLYKGQPYFFDFTQHEEVYPRYEDLPYRVELAANYPNPAWLHIENNQISIDKVPDFLKGDQTIFLTIQNIPGGLSDVLAVNINLVN